MLYGHAFAGRITRGTLDADVVISTGSIRVYGLLVSNTSGGALTINFVDDDGTARMTLVVGDDETVVVDIPWLADNGLTVSSAGDALAIVTVMHSSVGA